MEKILPPIEDEKWEMWQWLVIIGLVIAILVTLYFYLSPKKDYKNVYNPASLTFDQEIQSYKKQLGNSNNYVAYNRLAGAYVRQARKTGDPSWYILAEQNAKASLLNSPVSNYGALMILASTNMAKHDFIEAKKMATQMLDDPNAKIDALGIIFDADYAIGDLKTARKDLEEIEKIKAEYFKTKMSGVDAKTVPDMVDDNRHALLDYSEGKVKEADQNFLKAIKDSAGIDGEPKAWIYNIYATFLTKNGRFKEAKENIQYSLNSIPGYTSALVQKSEIARQEKNWQQIIDNLTEVNNNVPRSDIILRLAEAEKNLGHKEKYLSLLNQAETMLKEETSIGGYGHRRDYILLLLEKNTPQSLKQALEKAESEKKIRKDLDTLLIVTEAEIKNNQWNSAKDTINTIVKTGVKDANLFYYQGRLTEKSGDKSKANDYYKQAIALNPIFNPEHAEYIKNFQTGINK